MTTNGTEFASVYKTSDGYTFDNYSEAASHARRVNGSDYADWESIEVTNRVMKGERYLELSDLEVLLTLDKKEEP